MTVYVDTMKAPYRGMIMCHMAADTTEELILMANSIGVAERWIQRKGTRYEHFDISLGKKRLALLMGAKEITRKEMVKFMMEKKV